MKLLFLTLYVWTLLGPEWIEGYRILAIFPFHGKSHFMMFERLSKGLADRGHQVDVISTFPLKKPYKNYTDLVTLPLPPKQLVNNMDYDFIMDCEDNSVTASIAHMGGNEPCENLNRSEIHAIVRDPPRNPPYDLVMIEVFGAHCYAIIGHLLNVPVVGVSSSALYPWSHDMIGNPENLAFMSNNLLNFGHKMNLWQRVYNTIHSTYNKLFFQHTISVQDDMIKKNFGSHMPSVRELERKLAMILTNSHMSLNGISPMTPALIEVGGLHVHDDGAELSPALKRWLDESNDGFIYFSFGSMVRIETFPRKILDIFYKSIRKIAPTRVLMKIVRPEELPPNLPKNVLTLPWIPQLKVLKHRNIKAFITHGGLMGTQEAVHCMVPMIGIPLFADQFINVDLYVSKHIAVRLDHETLTEEKMDAALKTILKDPSYKEAIRKISSKFLDRPLSPMDTAAYWIEYIIKYGEDALRSPAMDLTWWQIQLLDVYAIILISIIVILSAVIVLTRSLMNLIFPMIRADLSHKKKVT